MTKFSIFFVLFFMLTNDTIKAQNKVELDCNTIFLGVDSITYHSLFANKYLKDTLFFCRQVQTNTNKEDYTGKYFIGESATIEFFCAKPAGKLGDKLGDVGLELKTRQINQLDKLISRAEKLKLKIDTTNVFYQADTTLSWYNTISLASKNENFGFYTLEYQASYLKYVGFTDAEIALPITYAQYNAKRSGGKPYPRLFASIKSIKVSANTNQLKTIKTFCKLNGFSNRQNKSFTNSFTVFYEKNNPQIAIKLKQIKIALLSKQPKRTIMISDALTVAVDGHEATLIFN